MSLAPDILQRDAQEVTTFLRQFLLRHADAPPRLIEAIEYSLLAPGKRLRPTLVLESFAACDGPDAMRPSALAAAGAIELIHAFSLVHDDLPAMDDDDLRRGRPTNHKVFGEALAILAGDAMVTMAFDLLAGDSQPSVAHLLVRELASAAGPEGMIGGQVLDMEGENKSLQLEELQRLHRKKTGALIRAAVRLGAIAAGSNPHKLAQITTFGQHLGLAFQIVDDLLDVTATPQQLGKATGKDASRGKNTYPSLLGIQGARNEAQRQLDSAIDCLAHWGESAQPLRLLARFVFERSQ